METHLIVVTDAVRRFVAVPRDLANAVELAEYHDSQIALAANTQDEREFHQRAYAYYRDCEDAYKSEQV